MVAEAIGSLARTPYLYVADNGLPYILKVRTAYAALHGMTAYTNQANNGYFVGRPRHAWIQSTNADNNHVFRRKIPTNSGALAPGQPLAPGTAIAGPLDGLSWVVHGHVGEKVRA